MADTVDPLAGSYFIESLTSEICDKAEAYIKKIDEIGGAVSAIEQGYVQREIQDSAYQYQREIEQGEKVVVGLNKFQVEEEKPTNLLRVDPSVRVDQIERLRKLKSERDEDKVKRCLSDLSQAAGETKNLLPSILAAVKTYATLGEICDVLRDVFGEYQQVSTLGS